MTSSCLARKRFRFPTRSKNGGNEGKKTREKGDKLSFPLTIILSSCSNLSSPNRAIANGSPSSKYQTDRVTARRKQNLPHSPLHIRSSHISQRAQHPQIHICSRHEWSPSLSKYLVRPRRRRYDDPDPASLSHDWWLTSTPQCRQHRPPSTEIHNAYNPQGSRYADDQARDLYHRSGRIGKHGPE